MRNYYEIRDDVVPSNKEEEFKLYLLQLEKDNRFSENDIAKIFGQAIFSNSIIIISLLRLFISDHKIKPNKELILEGIYDAECRMIASNAYKNHRMVSFGDFDEQLLKKYSDLYSDLIS